MNDTADNSTQQAGYVVANAILRGASTTPPDAEAVARRELGDAINEYGDVSRCSAQIDALVEAVERRVRAECGEDTKRLDWLAANSQYFGSAIEMEHGEWLDHDAPNLRAAIDGAMDTEPEAHP